MKITKIFTFILFISLLFTNLSFADEFNNWLTSFKSYALEKGISQKTLDLAMSNVKFLPNVIKYDRYQPEFYEDTKTYISKRTSDKKVIKGKNYH